jgi:hypothetical protein
VGALLIYSSLFLYEHQERGVENSLERWWIRISDLHAQAISRQTAFLKVVAEITSKGFARLFGERLFGPKALAASICYSQAAILIVLCFIIADWTRVVWIGLICLFFLVLGSFGAFIERLSWKVVWLCCVLIVSSSWLPVCGLLQQLSNADAMDTRSMPSVLAGVLPLAVACDFLFIALTREMLSRAARSNTFNKIITLALLNAALGASLVYFPMAFFMREALEPHYEHAVSLFLAYSNSLDAFVSLAWFLVAIAMLLHRVVWPLLERPVYALYRYRVFSEHKKLVFSSGVALLGFAVPSVSDALEKLIRALHG